MTCSDSRDLSGSEASPPLPWREEFLATFHRLVGPERQAAAQPLLPVLASLWASLTVDQGGRRRVEVAAELAHHLGGDFARRGGEANLAADQVVALASHVPEIIRRWGPEGFDSALEVTRMLDAFIQGAAAGVIRQETSATHRRLREANCYILRERRRYYSIFKRMTEPACIVDHQLRLLETNRAFDRFFGLDGQHIGRNCYEILGEEFKAGCDLASFLLHAEGGISRMEVRLVAAGAPRVVLVNGTFLGDINHESTGGIIILQDVTAKRAAEAELSRHHFRLAELVDERTSELLATNQQLKKEIAIRRRTEQSLVDLTTRLAASNAELDQFAHVASHDLKEPLMLILAFSERLAKRCGVCMDEGGREYLARIQAAAARMRQLIDGLLALSQVTSQARPYEEIDLETLVGEVLEGLEERINESHALIEVGKLGRLGGDRVQIRQLFQNLIANALKYHKPEVQPRVMLRGRMAEDGHYEIVIQDNGIGFAPEDAERIFRPLERLHSRREYEGTGMGLTTCRKIVARHGGEISAQGLPGEGATFIVRLPVGLDREPEQG